MERKPYSAGAVKFSFWFMEFRKTVQLLSEGKSFADIKKLNEETNIYGAPTKLRAQQIYSTVTARIKTLDESFYPIFLSSDLATQKLFVLTAALLHDTLFFDFVYTPTERRYLLRVPLILDAKKDCSRHALQSPDFSYCEVNPLLFRLPLSPLLLRLQSVCLYRSYRPAARQAAAARWISPHCCSGRKIDLPKYDTGLQGHRIPVNSAVVPCSRYSQGSAGKYITRRLPFCGSRRIHFSRLL